MEAREYGRSMQGVEFTRAAHIAGGRGERGTCACCLAAECIVRFACGPARIHPCGRPRTFRHCSIDRRCAGCTAGWRTGIGFIRLSCECAHFPHCTVRASCPTVQQRAGPSSHWATGTGGLFTGLSSQCSVASDGTGSAGSDRSESRPFTEGTQWAANRSAHVRAIESFRTRRTVAGGARRTAEASARGGSARNTGGRFTRRTTHVAIFASGTGSASGDSSESSGCTPSTGRANCGDVCRCTVASLRTGRIGGACPPRTIGSERACFVRRPSETVEAQRTISTAEGAGGLPSQPAEAAWSTAGARAERWQRSSASPRAQRTIAATQRRRRLPCQCAIASRDTCSAQCRCSAHCRAAVATKRTILRRRCERRTVRARRTGRAQSGIAEAVPSSGADEVDGRIRTEAAWRARALARTASGAVGAQCAGDLCEGIRTVRTGRTGFAGGASKAAVHCALHGTKALCCTKRQQQRRRVFPAALGWSISNSHCMSARMSISMVGI